MTTEFPRILILTGSLSKRSFLLPGQRPPNRKRHTWLWRLAFFALGCLVGWLAGRFV